MKELHMKHSIQERNKRKLLQGFDWQMRKLEVIGPRGTHKSHPQIKQRTRAACGHQPRDAGNNASFACRAQSLAQHGGRQAEEWNRD